MKQSYSPALAKLIHQIEKLRKQLQRFNEAVLPHSIYTKQSLQKRYERYLQKLVALSRPAFKAGTALSAMTFLTVSASAQSPTCDSFRVADRSNPTIRIQSNYHNCGNPQFVDIDGDGDYDCFETYNDYIDGINYGHILFMRNIGTKEIPSFVVDTASGFPSDFMFPVGSFVGNLDGLKFADLDGDGDLDCVLPQAYGRYGGSLRCFQNTGTASVPHFTERTGTDNPFNFVVTDDGLRVSFADIDNDGDYDLLVSSQYNQNLYQNIGGKRKPAFKLYSAEHDPINYPYVFFDWNKDGLLDEFTHNNTYYENTGLPKHPVFTQSADGPWLQGGATSIIQFVDLNNDGFIDIYDYTGNLLTTAPDPYIVYDSTKSNILHAYPRTSGYTFRWLRNGTVIPGATSSNYTATQPGTYVVQVTGSCGTGVSLATNVYASVVAVNGEAGNFVSQNPVTAVSAAAIKTYPNPFTSSFVLQLDNSADLSKTTIRITDISGRRVQTIQPHSYTVQLGESLAKGVFVVEVRKDKTVVHEGKIVKE